MRLGASGNMRGYQVGCRQSEPRLLRPCCISGSAWASDSLILHVPVSSCALMVIKSSGEIGWQVGYWGAQDSMQGLGCGLRRCVFETLLVLS